MRLASSWLASRSASSARLFTITSEEEYGTSSNLFQQTEGEKADMVKHLSGSGAFVAKAGQDGVHANPRVRKEDRSTNFWLQVPKVCLRLRLALHFATARVDH
jgi:hypothetical protein